jgi:hypothetical protein
VHGDDRERKRTYAHGKTTRGDARRHSHFRRPQCYVRGIVPKRSYMHAIELEATTAPTTTSLPLTDGCYRTDPPWHGR